MGLITKAPPKRLTPLAPKVKELRDNLLTCSDDALPEHVGSSYAWPFPRTDLFHWLAVLNRFDTLLEKIVKEYITDSIQSRPFEEKDQVVLLSVLRFTTVLWENCTNRSLYNSYEHLTALLLTSDLDVLSATLRLLLRPAQRLGNQRSVKNTLAAAHERTSVFAQHWGSAWSGVGIRDIASSTFVIPVAAQSVDFKFYRTDPSAVSSRSQKSVDLETPTKPKGPASAAGGISPGLVTIHSGETAKITEESDGKVNVRSIFEDLTKQYSVPQDQHLALFHAVRIAAGCTNVQIRRQLLTIRLLAISIIATLGTDEQLNSKVLTYEPDLIQKLADTLQADNAVMDDGGLLDVQTATIFALDSIAHQRSRLSEVLNGMNASANHGTLMFVLRKIVNDIASGASTFGAEYLDAFFAFLTYISTTQSGGNMIISAGILPVLVQLMGCTTSTHLRTVTKNVLLLDSLIFGFVSSFAPFAAANGLETLVDRIKEEVQFCDSLKSSTTSMELEDGTSVGKPDIPHERTAILRALLKFVLHMMQTSGTADRLRNLVETTLPASLLAIFQDCNFYGASVFGLSVNIMSTFIHNEPTCLPILQEAQLPQALLTAISSNIPVSAEVVSALPTAFGAICLNQPGLDKFNEVKPIENFLNVLISEEHIRSLQDNDVPNLVGNSMDELIRHHPSLKDDVMSAIIKVLKKVIDLGQVAPSAEERRFCCLATSKSRDLESNVPRDEDKRDSKVAQFVDIIARFLEGLFQNPSHSKEFMKLEGAKYLLDFYALPTLPFDFASSGAPYSLSYLFRVMLDGNAGQVVTQMLTRILEASKLAESLLSLEGPVKDIKQCVEIEDEDSETYIHAQKLFRALASMHGYVRLLSDVYGTPILSHARSVVAVIQLFNGDQGDELLCSLGNVYRSCVWQNILLKAAVPAEWYHKPDKKIVPEGNGAKQASEAAGSAAAVTPTNQDAAVEVAPNASSPVEDKLSENDYRVANTQSLRTLLTQIPTILTPTMQGVVKLLTSRRISDSSQKKQGQHIVDNVAKSLRDHLSSWPNPCAGPAPTATPSGNLDFESNHYNYLAFVLGVISVMFVEERNNISLQTNLVVAFIRCNGLHELLSLIERLWSQAESLHDTGGADKDTLERLYGALELGINVLQILTNGRILQESPLTQSLANRDKDRSSAEYFDATEHIITVRSQVAPLVARFWKSPFLKHAPANVLKAILATVTHILKSDGETKSKTDDKFASLGGLTASLFGRAPLRADAEALQELINMGFPQSAAEQALIRSLNNLGAAAEYLLTHPNLVASALASASGSGGIGIQPSASGADASPSNPEALEPPAAEDPPSADNVIPAVESSEQAPPDAAERSAEGTVEPMQTDLASTPGVDESNSAQSPNLAEPQTTDHSNNAEPTADQAGHSVEDATLETKMDIDSAANVRETELAKRKQNVQESLESLNSMRKDIREGVNEKSMELLDYCEDIVFHIKELFCLSGKDEMSEPLQHLFAEISSCFQDFRLDKNEVSAKRLSLRLRLLALIMNDPAWQEKAIFATEKVLPELLKMITFEEAAFKWLTPSLLAVEAYISVTDEPVDTSKVAEGKGDSPTSVKAAPLDLQQRLDLMQSFAKLFEVGTDDAELLHAVLRLVVRLTCTHEVAVLFTHLKGVQFLFKKDAIGQFQSQPAMTMMILRHIIENQAVLQFTMEREISHWLSFPRAKVVDIATYVKNCGHMVSRDPNMFIKSTSEICHLARYDPNFRQQQIALKALSQEKDKEGEVTDKGKEEVSGEAPVSTNPFLEAKEPAMQTTEKDNSENAEHIVHFLISELLALADKKEADSTATDESNTKTELELKTIHLQRSFYMQCLVELVVGYTSCKSIVVSAATKKSKGALKTGKNIFLHHLVHDLLPCGLSEPAASEADVSPLQQRRIRESGWATRILSGLCLGLPAATVTDPVAEKDLATSLNHARRVTLDVVYRNLRECLTHHESESTEEKYSRFLALGNLCYKMLTARGPSISPSNMAFSPDETQTQVAKIMLEKGFVVTLTQMLGELDIHHPQHKSLITSILMPIELLTKAARHVGSTLESKDSKSDSNVEAMSLDHPLLEEGNTEEISDILRNSALGMYNAPSSDEDDDDIDDDSDDDGAYDYITDEEMSDADDNEDDEGSDEEDEMEIVLPHSYQGSIMDNDSDDSSEDDEDNQDDADSDDDENEDVEVVGTSEDDEEMSWDEDPEAGHNQYHDINAGSAPINRVEQAIADIAQDEQEEAADDEEYDSEEDRRFLEELDDSELEDGQGMDGSDMLENGLEHYLGGGQSRMSLSRFGGGRPRARRPARRQVMEVDVNPSGALDITWVAHDGGSLEGMGDFQVLGRPLPGRNITPFSTGDSLLHPLLQQSTNQRRGNESGTRGRGAAAVRAGDILDWQAFDDLIGGSALQLLEQIFTRSGGGGAVPHRAELPIAELGSGGLASISVPGFTSASSPDVAVQTSKPSTAEEKLDEQLANIHACSPLGASERWWQEARLMYGTTASDKAARIIPQLLKEMLPYAQEELRKRKEKEEMEKKAKEEERRIKEEEERLKQEEEERVKKAADEKLKEELRAQEASQELAGSPSTEAMDVTASSSSEAGPSAPTATEERVVININGNPVDITGSGIDVEFLEALPDDLRQEVLSQHMREQQRSQAVTAAPATISFEFLDALPDDIREEVLAQERREQDRQNSQSATANAAAAELDPASFFATLDPHLRQTMLLEQEDGFLATLPPSLVAEANASRMERGRPRHFFGSTHPHLPGSSHLDKAPVKRAVGRDAIHLLEKPSLVTLLRLLFLPEIVGKHLLHKSLMNLCENSRTRVEVMSLLLSILADGSTNLAAVDRSFSQLSIKGKGKSDKGTPKKGTSSGHHHSPQDGIPNLVAQRCLDALLDIVSVNESSAKFFLTETEPSSLTLVKTPKKAKGKERASDVRYPVSILLGLLHRPELLNSSGLMEQLMHLLATILRRLPFVLKSRESKEAKKVVDAPKADSEAGNPEASAAEGSQQPAPPVTPKKPTIASVTESKSFALPEHHITAVVNVLTAGVMSSKTFQYTLSAIQQLSNLPQNREVLIRELVESAQKLGDSIVEDFSSLLGVLRQANTPIEVQAITLDSFSSPSAQQAKLLRVLKTMDFIFSKSDSEADSKSKATDKAEKDSTPQKAEEFERLAMLYDKLELHKLWHALGHCLRIIGEKEALVHVATVLLPAIESFMVVSRPYVLRKKVHVPASSPPSLVRASTRSSMEQDIASNEDLFFAFTEDHRKILNTMVRNSPSLMSGSFSLLVQNPKVLEFDNKRTYFQQQLHKRASRDHYGGLQVNVRRQYVFEDSYHQLQGRTGEEIKFSKLNVRFYEEEGVDAGGVTREWFSVLARQMFNPDYALFRPSAVDKVTYQPNRLSFINPDHLLYFKFVGRVIGKAIYDGRLLDAYFTRSFYKAMIDAPVDYKDMEAVDPEFHKSLEWILQNDNVEVLDFTFSTEIDEFGKKQTIDLKPDGSNLQVTEENKHEYVKLVVEQRLRTAIKAQIDAFLSGFHEIIPQDLVKIFNEQELELLISGMPDIDVDDWKNNTEYQNFSASSPQVQWFWRAVRSFSQEERAKLVQFVTGTSKVPLEGFAELQGSSGVQKFQIHKDFASTDRLPSAHTCFNQLDLPLYETYEQLRASLLIAISEGATGNIVTFFSPVPSRILISVDLGFGFA
ncbi:hypothetical protein DFS34DRAFT_502229 [Phlyctochytrium arcticum]|nr:hypothetical protein DFS34DRAFT_502229 [Phlyctochytrium arcticum]